MKIKAILFDLDGVLVDATEWHYEALNRALGLFGYNIARYEHLTTYNGLPTRKKLEMLSVEKGFPRGLHSLVNKIKQKYTREEILRSCTPVFEKEFMVHQLKRDGYKLAVCSNSIRESVELMLRGSGLWELFDCVLSNEDVKQAEAGPGDLPDGVRAAGREAGGGDDRGGRAARRGSGEAQRRRCCAR